MLENLCASATGNLDQGEIEKKQKNKTGYSEGHASQAHSPFLMSQQQRASDNSDCLLLGVELFRREGQGSGRGPKPGPVQVQARQARHSDVGLDSTSAASSLALTHLDALLR